MKVQAHLFPSENATRFPTMLSTIFFARRQKTQPIIPMKASWNTKVHKTNVLTHRPRANNTHRFNYVQSRMYSKSRVMKNCVSTAEYKATMTPRTKSLVEGVLAGNRSYLAQAITLGTLLYYSIESEVTLSH
jgi:hypothetical protein